MSPRGPRTFDAGQEAVDALPAGQGGELQPAARTALDEQPAPAQAAASAQLQPGAAGQVPAAAGAAAPGALARFASAGQAALATGAWRVRRIGSAGMVGIGLMVGAAVLYTANTLPQGKAIAALKAQLAKLGPAAGGTGTGPTAQVSLGGLPSRDEASDVLGRIYDEAEAAGVQLPKGTYEYVPGRDGVAAHYRMTFPVHASYPQLRSFMDHTLVALPSVAVEGLRIERKNVTDETVDAELKLSAYVRDTL